MHSLCHGAPESPPGTEQVKREKADEGAGYVLARSEIIPLRSCSQPLTQAGFKARQGAINKALWQRGVGGVLGLSVPLKKALLPLAVCLRCLKTGVCARVSDLTAGGLYVELPW